MLRTGSKDRAGTTPCPGTARPQYGTGDRVTPSLGCPPALAGRIQPLKLGLSPETVLKLPPNHCSTSEPVLSPQGGGAKVKCEMVLSHTNWCLVAKLALSFSSQGSSSQTSTESLSRC